jgi:aspartyl-tRNA(Asn)/glutamyl-tRNA(Gln) amidotransferase subunit C
MDKSELKTTAALARLSLGEGEAQKLTDMVDQMLSYFTKMREIDVDHLTPTTHAFQEENVVRPDEPEGTSPEELLNRAPERDERFFTIPNVL